MSEENKKDWNVVENGQKLEKEIESLKAEIAELKDSVAFEKRNFLLKENAELKAENERLVLKDLQNQDWLNESWDKQTAMVSQIEKLRTENERLRNERSEINFNWWEVLALNDCVEPTPEAVKKYVLELQELYAKEQANEILAEIERGMTQAYEGACDVVYFDDVRKAFAKFAQENSDKNSE